MSLTAVIQNIFGVDPESKRVNSLLHRMHELVVVEGGPDHSITQKTLLQFEVLAAEAAKEIWIYGFDSPIIAEQDYATALTLAKKRGARISALVHEADISKIHNYLPPQSRLLANENEYPQKQGFRLYSCGIFYYVNVDWDATRRSPIEPDVAFRKFEMATGEYVKPELFTWMKEFDTRYTKKISAKDKISFNI